MSRVYLLLCSLVLFSQPLLASGITGVWQTQTNKDGYLHVELSKCGDFYCGVILKAFKKSGEEGDDYKYLGKQMIWNMQDRGNGRFTGGKIFAPDREKTYSGNLRLNGDQLVVRGCVLGGVICRGQTWNRVSQAEGRN